ncbi:MAG: flagellar hook-length control protein FliK, partial [Nitrosomonas sp.]
GGKLLPFSPELNEAILANNGGSGESFFSITAESVPNLSLGGTHAASSISQHLPAHTIQVDQPLGQPRWNGEFTQKIVWLTSQQHQVAEIHLNPVHLGPVDVMLSITQDQATAQFVSPHLAVREAIEQALPRLREMMAENGIQLGNVMVGAESFQQDNKQQRFFSEQASHDAKSGSTTASTMRSAEPAVVTNRHNGIVNTYA